MDYIEVTLSDNKTVKVYPVPPYVTNQLLAKFVDPPVPMRPVNPEVDIPGAKQELPDPENHEYLAAKEKVDAERAEAYMKARLLYGLRDETPPEDWPSQDELDQWAFLDIVVDIPKDKQGKRLAWIKYGLLKSGHDLEKVMVAIDSFLVIDKEDVKNLINSFRDQHRKDPAK
jgi:hypothetical protein